MEWKVQNALSRDVERQHLNKILKDIANVVSSMSGAGSAITEARVLELIKEVVLTSSKPISYRLTLDGDVTGSATLRPGSTTLTTELAESYLEDAPIDSATYWRRTGEWLQVAEIVTNLEHLSGDGFPSLAGTYWAIRQFDAVDGELVVTNPTGVGGNPTYGLADVPNSGEGDGVVRTYTRDGKGRIVGDEEATTDNLPEGTVNLYYTTERGQSPVVNLPEVGTVVADPSLKGSWLETSSANVNLFLAGSWSRGDELSIHAQDRLALVGGAITLTTKTGTFPVAESFGSVVHVKFISPTLARVWGDLSSTPDSFNLLTETGDFLMTESGDNLVVL